VSLSRQSSFAGFDSSLMWFSRDVTVDRRLAAVA
jgi:hypothetical protein